MGDTETSTAPAPATKEKKKKKSVKSSEKKSANASNDGPPVENAVTTPEVNVVPPPTTEESIEAKANNTEPLTPLSGDDINILSILKTGPKFTIAGESDPDKPKRKQSTSTAASAESELEKQRQKKKKQQEEKIAELAEAFHLLDVDQDGFIGKLDLQMTFDTLGKSMRDADLQKMIEEADSPLNFPAFVKLLGTKTLDLDTEDTLINALSYWDKENTGFVPEELIKHDLMTWGDRFSEQEVDCAFEDAPIFEDAHIGNKLDYLEFIKQLCGLND